MNEARDAESAPTLRPGQFAVSFRKGTSEPRKIKRSIQIELNKTNPISAMIFSLVDHSENKAAAGTMSQR
jgi:hypothetical protein